MKNVDEFYESIKKINKPAPLLRGFFDMNLDKDLKEKVAIDLGAGTGNDTKFLIEKGFKVTECKVEAKIGNEEEETQITKIKLNVKKETNSQDETNERKNTIEDKIVVEVQKIKPINTEKENENRICIIRM